MDGTVMKREDVNGYFTKNLFSLQLQIKSLLDGAGGSEAGKLLDTLSEMSESEQTIALGVFQRALDKILEAEIRLQTLEDKAHKDFEETLYEEIVDGIAALKVNCSERAFHVVDGGKLPTRKKEDKGPLCFSTAKRKKAEGHPIF